MARRTEIPPGEVITIAMAGNPNVGKSTLFNAVTGLNQHTGNWPGKTVASAEGLCRHGGKAYRLVDLPGTYSLLAHSAEEEVARNFLCFSRPEAVCIVCDATCLERNLNLVLQTLEITPRAAICLNLMDEAKKRKLRIEPARLEALLGVPVMGCTARQKNTPARLFSLLERATGSQKAARSYMPRYPEEIEKALVPVCRVLQKKDCRGLAPRWVALRLLEGDPTLMEELDRHLGPDFRRDAGLFIAMTEAERLLAEGGIPQGELPDRIVATLAGEASRLAAAVVTGEEKSYSTADRRLDKVLTGRRWGIPIMLGLLAVIFWLTISGANLPSALLAKGLFRLQDLLSGALLGLGVPLWLHDALILGVYRVAAWVVSVMLPPMAIFFPLFTLLEDLGVLPRIAFNLDKGFARCNACGKQALTMCMGFGCNAAGVVGCRIISGKRERLIAILTNSFVPCNGRFPMLIALISLFLAGNSGGSAAGSLTAAGVLALVVVFSAAATLAVSFILSKTLLRGESSAFTLELPPYRVPRIGQVIVRSVLDRTLHVLGRAAAVAAPWGLAVYALANISAGGETLLSWFCSWLDPAARLIGLDGVILAAFILGLPANELVIPIMLMAYTSGSCLTEISSYAALSEVLSGNGWTAMTAVSAVLFTLMHSPCSTTLLTIKKETGSIGWTAAAAVIPTAAGIGLLAVLNCIFG
mgnify:CR=1 FL=1